MNQSRTILAVALSMLVFFVYAKWFAPPPQPGAIATQAATLPENKRGLAAPASMPEGAIVLPKLPEGQDVVLENDQVKAVFSTAGGVLTGFTLKNYSQTAEKNSPPINLLNEGKGKAFLLSLGNAVHDQGVLYSSETDSQKIVFDWKSGGLEVQKTYSIRVDNPHLIDLAVEVTNHGKSDLNLDPRLWISRMQKAEPKKKGGFFSFIKQKPDFYTPMQFINGKFKVERNWAKLPPSADETGQVYWTGLSDRYFILSLISRLESSTSVVRYGKENDGEIYTSLSYGALSLRPGEVYSRNYSAYLGPKKRDELKALGVNLEKSVDYGWFGFLATPLLWLLIAFEKFLKNWGLAIIALTFFIKMLLHPVNKKSMESMKAMQVLQPELQKIKERYKNDKEKLNMEMMLLFKSHKVNPMGGCLPMVLQMPVYIALYKVLWNAVELYHAPFVGFYKDLSAPDPYMISPILLGIMMSLQQKLTPQATTMDPAQQKMMMIMPLMFSSFMIFLPSGLVIYIFVNTIMSVIQQYMMHKNISFVTLWRKYAAK